MLRLSLFQYFIIVTSYATFFSIGWFSKSMMTCQDIPLEYPEKDKTENNRLDSTTSTSIQTSTTTTLINENPKETFTALGMKYGTDKVTFHHYELMYEKYLKKYQNMDITMLEIGLGCGMAYDPGMSAFVWREYFGPGATIHFIEYDRKCGEAWYNKTGKKLNVIMHYGNQEDAEFLKSFVNLKLKFDIIIDDGGHSMKQQITSLTYLLDLVVGGGFYAIEDIYTSYKSDFGGGYHRNSTTIELLKTLVDDIQEHTPLRITNLANRLRSIEISNKICFLNISP